MVYYSNLVSINSIKIIQRPLILRAVSVPLRGRRVLHTAQTAPYYRSEDPLVSQKKMVQFPTGSFALHKIVYD